jgi:hypothetical protein
MKLHYITAAKFLGNFFLPRIRTKLKPKNTVRTFSTKYWTKFIDLVLISQTKSYLQTYILLPKFHP